MSNEVYANGREVSCKAANGKSVAAFPDVCLTPPSPPAGPLPIPYPNTGMASDTADGSKSVKVSGKEVNLKDSSYFKKSTGDEAATKAQGMSVITHQIQGKVYFKSWSMDVKIEGENVVRHMDLTTHNHASETGATPPHPYLDAGAIVDGPECDDLDGTLEATMTDGELPRSKTKSRGKKKEDGTVSEYNATIAVGFANGGIVGGASSIGRGLVQGQKARVIGNKYEQYSEGIKRGERSKVVTCDGNEFVYVDSPSNPKQGHAEAKIIEDWFKAGAKGKLLLNPSKTPCPDCSRMINEVNKGEKGKKCDKIEVCKSSVSR